MSIDPAQKRQFEDKGLLVLESYYPPETMERVSDWLATLQERPLGDEQEARYHERSVDGEKNILSRIEYILNDRNKEIRDLLLDKRTLDDLAALLGDEPVLFKDKVNYKLPGCRADKLHQDQAAGWNRFSDFFISIGVVVDASREDNAALSFLSSGNYEKKLMTEEWMPLCETDPPYEPQNEYLLLEANPGDVVFFDSYVPHGSPPNTSDRSRRILFLTFNRASDGDLRESYYEHKWSTYPPNEADAARESDSFLV